MIIVFTDGESELETVYYAEKVEFDWNTVILHKGERIIAEIESKLGTNFVIKP